MLRTSWRISSSRLVLEKLDFDNALDKWEGGKKQRYNEYLAGWTDERRMNKGKKRISYIESQCSVDQQRLLGDAASVNSLMAT
jgi:hypothetical protein